MDLIRKGGKWGNQAYHCMLFVDGISKLKPMFSHTNADANNHTLSAVISHEVKMVAFTAMSL